MTTDPAGGQLMEGQSAPGAASAGKTSGEQSSEGRSADDHFFDDEVTIRLPAQSIYVAVLRTAVAGVAARADFTLDDIEDLRIAVDEACSLLLERAAPDATLSCHITGRPSTVAAAVSSRVTVTTLPDTNSFGWLVLNALVGAVEADVDGDVMTVMLSRTRAG